MQSRSKETRSRILKVSLDLFSKLGYDGTGIADICNTANVSKGAFYHHFRSKQAVFLALLYDWLNELDSRMQGARSSTRNVPEDLISMAGITREVFEAAGGRFSMFLEFWIQANRQPVIWESTVSPYRRYQQMFSSIIEEGVEEGSLAKEVNPDSAARVIIALALGLLLQAFFDPKGTVWDELTKEGMQMLMNGIVRR
jgi:AcrR family transcriptional regulator